MQPPDNFTYLIFVDYELHTIEKPFCYDQDCECHVTPDEATNFVRGKGI